MEISTLLLLMAGLENMAFSLWQRGLAHTLLLNRMCLSNRHGGEGHFQGWVSYYMDLSRAEC